MPCFSSVNSDFNEYFVLLLNSITSHSTGGLSFGNFNNLSFFNFYLSVSQDASRSFANKIQLNNWNFIVLFEKALLLKYVEMLRLCTFAMRERKSNLIIRSIVINPGEGIIPYRLSDWNEFRKEKCMYVDQTAAIANLDNDTIYSSLWSPRRTGKSLLCHQLELWHDKAIPKEEVKYVSFYDCEVVFNRGFIL